VEDDITLRQRSLNNYGEMLWKRPARMMARAQLSALALVVNGLVED